MTTDLQALHKTIVEFVQTGQQDAGRFFHRMVGLLPEPQQLFGLDQLFALLTNPLLTPDWLQVVKSGQNQPIDQDQLWKTVQRRKLLFLDKSGLNQALRNGASLVLEGLDILDPNINQLLTRLDETMPCALSNCEAFFSRKGNEAYGGHRDSDDVLVIQIAGVKRWRVYEPQQRRYTGNSPLTEAQMGKLADTFDLAPGDALFVRAGVPHRVETTGDFSLHLSFDLIDRTPNIEQITHAANALFNQGLAPAHASPQEVVGQYVNRLQSPEFVHQLDGARQQIRQEARAFRQKMAGAHQSPFHGVKDGKVILK